VRDPRPSVLRVQEEDAILVQPHLVPLQGQYLAPPAPNESPSTAASVVRYPGNH
jgi:hypothetical protein